MYINIIWIGANKFIFINETKLNLRPGFHRKQTNDR